MLEMSDDAVQVVRNIPVAWIGGTYGQALQVMR